MPKWRKGWKISLAILMLLLVVACSSDNVPSADADDQDPDVGETGAKQLTVRFYDDPAGFDPANIFRIENETIAYNIFSGLTTYDSSGNLIPDLAESWESPDNKTWTFHLREGVQWHKGYGEFTADDVVYSYNRILDPETASPYAERFGEVVRLEAIDPHTVVIELAEPNGNFLHVVANHNQGQIVKQEAVEAAGDQVRWDPVGTGPYYMESIDVNSQIVLRRHEDYYLGPAPIEKITFVIIKDEQTATIALQNGEVDVVMRANREENIELLQNAGFKMNRVLGTYATVAMFNMENEYLSDLRVRQAFVHAIDQQSILEATSPNLASPGDSILPDWMDEYSENIPAYDYDPDRARELLAEAGYSNGITIRLLTTASTGVTDELQLWQEYLAAVGINLEFELVDAPTYNARRNSGQFDIASRGIPGMNPDIPLFSFLHSSSKSPGGLNGSRYDNPEMDALLEAARAEIDPEIRKQIYEDVQILMANDLPAWVNKLSHVYWPSKQNVVGLELIPLAFANFYDVDIE